MTATVDRPPVIELSFDRMFCAIHGEPFREQWPRDAVIFQLRAIEFLLHDEPTRTEAAQLAGLATGTPPDPKMIEAVLDKRPACCRLGGERLLEVYEFQHANKGIGAKGFCPNCGRFALGAPYRNNTPSGVQRLPHVCFRCVAMFIVPRNS